MERKEGRLMTERERLMAALFGREDREHIDIKFFVNAGVDVESEDFCREAVSMLTQMDAAQDADESFHEEFSQIEVAELIATV
jgi:hypothetical protein